MSQVLKGSGLSSSASFEVLAVTIISHLYNNGAIDPVTAAQISQYAENVYFGKPSGLMDQMASAVGASPPLISAIRQSRFLKKVEFSLDNAGYAMCIMDTGGSHADLTSDYAAIPKEMKQVAEILGCDFLREADETAFSSASARFGEKTGDRAVLRAMHFFADNQRAQQERICSNRAISTLFSLLIIESGRSSALCLQNAYSIQDPASQGVCLALAVSERLLKGKGPGASMGAGSAADASFCPCGDAPAIPGGDRSGFRRRHLPYPFHPERRRRKESYCNCRFLRDRIMFCSGGSNFSKRS